LRPTQALFLVLALYDILRQLSAHWGIDGIEKMLPVRDAIVVSLLFWMLYRTKGPILHKVSLRAREPLSKLFSIIFFVVFGLILLGIFQLDIFPLLAFGGIGAAAIGFAAKDVMSGFFCSIVLTLSRSFVVGDRILIPDKNIEGVIENMGWSGTLVRDRDRRAIYLPNTMLTQLVTINLSQRTGRRILEAFPLRHIDFSRLFHITSDVKAFLQQYDRLDQKAPILVFMSGIGLNSIDFSIDVQTESTSLDDYVTIREEILKNVSSIVLAHGAHIARPVYVNEQL